MRDKKRFISVILLTSVMLFAGGCSKQAEPVSAEPTETVKEVETGESVESSEAWDASEKEVDTTEEDEEVVEETDVGDEDEEINEDEEIVEEVETTKTDTTKTGGSSGSTNSGSNGSTNNGSNGSTNNGSNGSTNNGSNGSTNSGSSGSTNSSPSQPTPAPQPAPEPPQPAHTHNWLEHTATSQVWVPHIVVVDDYEYRVIGRTDDVAICNCGFTTTDSSIMESHIMNHILANENTQFTMQAGHDIIEEVKVGSHEEDYGHYETQTYVDYYYCECGEIKN